MDSWNNYDHRRSASIAGYNGFMYPEYDTTRVESYWNDNKMGNQQYTSFVDVNRGGTEYSDGCRKFSWRPKVNIHDQNRQPEKTTFQTPFESTFKEAISKMKASSISRINTVDKSFRNGFYDENGYTRDTMTLPPPRTTTGDRHRESTKTHKIFRCNRRTDESRDEVSSISTCPNDCGSDTRSDKTDKDNQYQSGSSLFLYDDRYQDRVPKNIVILPRKNTSKDELKLYSNSSIVIPRPIISRSVPETENRSTVPNENISERKQHTSKYLFQGPESCNVEKKFESVPLVYDSISKLATLNNERNNSLSLRTSNCQIIKKPNRNANQKPTEGFIMPSQGEPLNSQPKEMSGFYKKFCPSPVKGKSISSMPSDFKKLHLAFLEQKKEIKNLKFELDQKNNYIVQLECEIRSYEPWR